MNSEDKVDTYRSFLLLNEIANEEAVSQRELAGRLGIALGLVNSYLKNLVAKGYVRIKAFPRNRYAYLLTPQGFAEKTRLAYEHLSYFTTLYKVARQDYSGLFEELKAQGVRRVVFCGVDEIAEIAYLSLREAGMELAAVMDTERVGEEFFASHVVAPLSFPGQEIRVVITALKRGGELRRRMLGLGVDGNMISCPAGSCEGSDTLKSKISSAGQEVKP